MDNTDERDRAAGRRVWHELDDCCNVEVEEEYEIIGRAIAAARAEGVAEGAADKARLDWLMQSGFDLVWYGVGHWSAEWINGDTAKQFKGATPRAAIDAAKAEGEGGER